MPDERAICPICGGYWPENQVRGQAGNEAYEFSCLRCGTFKFVGPRQVSELGHIPAFLKQKHGENLSLQEATDLLKIYLSIYTRECFESGRPPVQVFQLLNPSTWEHFAETYANTSVEHKSDKLLRLLARRTKYPGEQILISPSLDYPAAHAINATQFGYYFKALMEDVSVETDHNLCRT
jgi:hypothetical protein